MKDDEKEPDIIYRMKSNAEKVPSTFKVCQNISNLASYTFCGHCCIFNSCRQFKTNCSTTEYKPLDFPKLICHGDYLETVI